MKNIIIIGSRGYNYPYGGWETFVTNLVKNTHDKNITYYIPCLTTKKEEDKKIKIIDHVICPQIYIKAQGFITMFLFTIKATEYFLKYIKKEQLQNVIILELGCKVGPFFPFWHHKLKKQNAKLIINPDGLEWKREKWPNWIKLCFKISESYCIRYSDYCVCDSKSIQKYVKEKYQNKNLKTKFIAFGAYENRNPEKNELVHQIFAKYHIKENEYFLIVGRFVPENNYELMIKEFMKTKTKKDLVIICNIKENEFLNHLKTTTHFETDKRIKFIGTVYEEEALLYIRKNACAYIHGHSVGGTNPSLLEALSITDINILFDVCYNKEVGENSCFYFNKQENSLKEKIEKVEKLTKIERKEYGEKAKQRIHENYTWEIIVKRYHEVFDELLQK